MRRATTGLVVLATAILVATAGGCSAPKDARSGAAGSRTGTGSTPSSSASDKTLEFVVPMGTAARIKAGERPEVFPQRLDVRVGDRIRITNQDSVGHTVGPYYVGVGETVEQVFTAPTTIEGYCSLHPESAVKIVVT